LSHQSRRDRLQTGRGAGVAGASPCPLVVLRRIALSDIARSRTWGAVLE
jgi:hypothetical protein